FGQLVVQITNDPPPPLPVVTKNGERVPAGLRELIQKCLEKEPANRPVSMGALADQLRPFSEISESQVIELPPPPAAPRSRRPLWAASIAGGAGLLVLGAWLVFGARAPHPLVHVTIDSTPSGAKVFRADTNETLGETPLEVELPRDKSLTLRVEHEGYQPRQLPV